MERFEIQKLRELPIEGVALRLGLRVNRHKCLCPLHGDNRPSLVFKVAKNTFRCYGCGVHGGTIDLVMEINGMSFSEACEWLADEHNIILTEYKPKAAKPAKPFDASRYERYFEHPWLSQEAQKFLFEERRLNPEVIKYCRLNSYRDWLQIPYYIQKGKLIGIQSRYMGNDPLYDRFRFPYGQPCHIYNLPVLEMLQQGEDLYMTEGPSDCWAMLSAGHKAIAIPSATLFDKQELMREFSLAHIIDKGITLHIYPDNDAAGESLYHELLAAADEMGLTLIRHDLPDGCKDFADYWKEQASPYPVHSQNNI